jgi:hypothetical protein
MQTESLLIFVAIVIFVYIFFLCRNEWVYKKRIEMIDNRFHEYNNYISYYEMIIKFWIWDIEKMRKVRE